MNPSTSPKSGARRRWSLLLIAAVVIGGLGYGIYSLRQQSAAGAANGPGGPGGRMPQPPVQVATASTADVPVWLGGLGTVTAASTVTVKSRVDGQLMKLHFTEGQTVRAGQLLAEIDPRPFQVSLAQAEGQLAKDQADLDNARADLARYRTLLAQESIAAQKVDTQASLVRQLQGTVKADRAQVDSARLQLDYSRVTAPVSGRVGLKQVDVGNQISSGDTTGIVVITQVQPIQVLFTLPETQLPSILAPLNAGQTLTVEAWDREMKQRQAVGKLLTLDNQIDTSTGTIKLKAEFANTDGTLFPNQFVNARVRAGTLSQAVVVPVAAVQTGKKGSYVWVVGADNKVAMRQVSTTAGDGTRVVISKGVQAGERLVTDGVDKLTAGARVEIVDPARLERNRAAAASKPAAQKRHKGQPQ
ncbi:MdtA/MuxA family multidrug efflux RND transporter periplasmic adaptor subunit [Microvirgula aerodenitrificans]|uniref:MdtA/MuxA family multidrug efflux RND transporter periplasmic adaptor subunit n=1 Tax=Microvirgula aerodenitrificans TaxID=57480 RepID=UPI0028E8FCBB|nr:MdtA/MuxA family multidrug efflux RND transporter periplasmic adaptor subunit [Microvirgula aerodenitrificans]